MPTGSKASQDVMGRYPKTYQAMESLMSTLPQTSFADAELASLIGEVHQRILDADKERSANQNIVRNPNAGRTVEGSRGAYMPMMNQGMG